MFVILTLLVALINTILGYFFEWWIIAIVPLCTLFFYNVAPTRSFSIGFVSTSSVWVIYTIIIDVRNKHILLPLISSLFKLNNSFLLILVIGLVSGIVGGLSALTGTYFRRLIL